MESQAVSEVVPQILEILDDLEPVSKARPSLVTSNEFSKLDTGTRLIVSKFLQEHPELRGNIEVSIIRRSVLRTAIERRIPFIGVGEILIAELTKLL
jgi:hypothetical protein